MPYVSIKEVRSATGHGIKGGTRKIERDTSMDKNIEIRKYDHQPFSPLLMEFEMPQHYVDRLNAHGDKISGDVIKSKKLDASDYLAGNVKQEHDIENHVWEEKISDEIPSLFNWVGACVNTYMQTLLQKGLARSRKITEPEERIMKEGIKVLEIRSSWIVNSVAGDFNPVHQHGGILSAAGWLMIPESIQKNEEKENAGYIEFMYGESLSLIHNKYMFKPQVGKMFMFPSWLQHTVYPFRGEGIRRSFSFNTNFKG